MKKHWPTWIEINLSNIKHNVKEIKKRIGDDICLMAVVKADAYGHGGYETSIAALQGGAEKLGVASVDEGIYLRKKGITVPILILGLSFEDAIEDIVKYNLMQTVCSEDLVSKLSKEAVKRDKTVKINIKVNTGMNRIGVEPQNTLELVRKIQKYQNVFIEGIYTHLATSYAESKYTNFQFKKFKDVLNELNNNNIDIPYKHCCNSGGVLNFPHMYLNQVRVGTLITTPFPALKREMNLDLKESFEFKSKIIFIRKLAKGQSVGYNRMYYTDKNTKIAIVSAGWGDGIPRELSNKGFVLVHGIKCPIRGRVCCDQIIVDVTEVNDVKVGDEVVIIGNQNGAQISAWEWGEILGGVSSPITLRNFVTDRVTRKYIE